MDAVRRFRATGVMIAIAIAVIDQAVKFWLLGPMKLRQVQVIDLLPFFDLRYAENPGISYGLFAATSLESRIALFAVTGGIALVVLIWMFRERQLWDIVALATVLGGAVGNIIDRVRFTYVVDYADFHIGTFRPFAIFNVADAAITLGVLLLLARALFIREKNEDDAATAGPAPQ